MTDKKTETKKNEMDQIMKIGNVKVNMGLNDCYPVMSHFPIPKFIEWEQDVKDNWNGIRWAKAYQDHEIAKQSKKDEAMWNMILGLKAEIDAMKSQPEQEEEPEEVKTLGQKKDKEGE